MKFNIDIRMVTIAVLIGIILFLIKCGGDTPAPIVKDRVVVETVVEYDTVRLTQTKYVPKYKEIIIYDIDTMIADVDTLSILKDYYAHVFYNDTILLDTLGYLIVNDTITQNRIASRDIQSEIRIPTTTTFIRETVLVNERELYVGPVLNFNTQNIQFLGANVTFKDRTGHTFNAGAGITPGLVIAYQFGIGWKLHKSNK